MDHPITVKLWVVLAISVAMSRALNLYDVSTKLCQTATRVRAWQMGGKVSYARRLWRHLAEPQLTDT
jgi:hypothetical protein